MKKASHTDWDRLAAMTDEEIDYSDIPPLSDSFFDRAVLRIPGQQAQNWVELDPEVVEGFKAQGDGYRAKINEVLRQHLRTQPAALRKPTNRS